MADTGLFYARFMDDWVVLSPTRWKLRKAVPIVNQTLTELKVRQHPEKTFVGRINRGFDFLGYAISLNGLKPARKTVKKFAERLCQLYEQGADACRIGQYIRHWWKWLNAGGLRVSVTSQCPGVETQLAWENEFSEPLTTGKYNSHLSFESFLLRT